MWPLAFARLVKAKDRMKVNTLHTGTDLDKHRNKYYYSNYFVYFKNRTQLGQVSRGTIPIPKDMSSSDHHLGFPWLVHRSTPWLYVSLFITNCPAQPVGIINFLRLFVWVIWFNGLDKPQGKWQDTTFTCLWGSPQLLSHDFLCINYSKHRTNQWSEYLGQILLLSNK